MMELKKFHYSGLDGSEEVMRHEKDVDGGWVVIILVDFSLGQLSSHGDHWYVGENPCAITRVQQHSIVVFVAIDTATVAVTHLK